MNLIPIKHQLTLILCTWSLIACVGNKPLSSSTPASQSPQVAAPLTISNPGVIQVTADSKATLGVYIHNNTNQDIGNIDYKISFNLPDHPASLLGGCKMITANNNCWLEFQIPDYENNTAPFAAIMQVNYTDNTGNQRKFGQILNFEYANTPSTRVSITPGNSISGYGNGSGYATIYLYGSTNQSRDKYVIDKLTLGKGLELVNHPDLAASKPGPGAVKAIEIKAATKADSYATSIGIKLTDSDEKLNSIIFVAGESEPGLLAKSFVPLLIAASESGSKSSVYLGNTGTHDITLKNVTASTQITINPDSNTCTGILQSGLVCEIPFSVDKTPGDKINSGSITVNYDNSSAVIPISWITNQADYAWASIASRDILPLIAGGAPVNEVITVTNNGRYSLTMAKPYAEISSGNAKITIIDGNNGNNKCENTVLLPGQSCSYTLSIADAKTEYNQSLTLYAQGSYFNGKTNQELQTKRQITYITKGWHPHIKFERSGDSFEQITTRNKKSAVYTITNDGDTPLDKLNVRFIPSNRINLESNTCTSNLRIDGQCRIRISYSSLIAEAKSAATLQAQGIADTAYGDKPYAESIAETYSAVGAKQVALLGTTSQKIIICDLNNDLTNCVYSATVESMDSSGALAIDPNTQTIYYASNNNVPSQKSRLNYCQYGDLTHCDLIPNYQEQQYYFYIGTASKILIQNKLLYFHINATFPNRSVLVTCPISESGVSDSRSCIFTEMPSTSTSSIYSSSELLGGLTFYTGSDHKQYAYTQWTTGYQLHHGFIAPIQYVGMNGEGYPATTPPPASAEDNGKSDTDPGGYINYSTYLATNNNFLYQSTAKGLQICKLNPNTSKVVSQSCITDSTQNPIAFVFNTPTSVMATDANGVITSYALNPSNGMFRNPRQLSKFDDAREIVIFGNL